MFLQLKCFSGVFASVLDACFKCFICLQIYAVSVASKYFKSRSVVATPSSHSVVSPRYLLPVPAGHLPPLPLFSMLMMFRAVRALRGRAKQHGKNTTGTGVLTPRSSGHPSASKPDIRTMMVFNTNN
jgi:hypothetical protein